MGMQLSALTQQIKEPRLAIQSKLRIDSTLRIQFDRNVAIHRVDRQNCVQFQWRNKARVTEPIGNHTSLDTCDQLFSN